MHADNGASQTSHTLKSKLEVLGISSSHSRSSISDNNAHIETWFRTCKYAPIYPFRGFESIQEARAWTLQFVTLYNGTQLQSALAYVTTLQRDTGPPS